MGGFLRKVGRTVVVAGVTALLVSPGVRAAEDVLVESIPANVDKAGALAAAKDALKYREWRVTGEDADSVSATISRSNVDAKIRIKVVGTRLLYEESALGRGRLDHTGRVTPSTISTPSRWIEYLRSDTTERLMARAAAPAATPRAAVAAPAKVDAAVAATPAASGRSSVQRLQELKEMLDRNLITAEEYARKKEEILKGL